MKNKFADLICGTFIFSSLSFAAYAQSIQATSDYQNAMQALGQGNYEQAYELFNSLMNSGRFRDAAMVEMGRVRQKQAESEMSKALAHYNEAADLINAGITSGGISGSETPKALYDLGRIYEEKLKNYVQAQDVYARIIDEYPSYMAIDKVFYGLACCQEAMGMYDEAVGNYQKVVSDYSYSSFFAAAQEKVRKLAPGTSVAETALETQKEWTEEQSGEGVTRANLDLGDMQAESGKFKQAAASYRKAIKESESPEESVEAYRKLVSMLDEKQKNYEEAAKVIEEMIQKYPDAKGNEDMVYRLGQIYEKDLDSMQKKVIDGQVRYKKNTENSRKAIEHYDSVTEKYPESDVAADAYLRKAEIYSELKEYSSARQSYENFLKQFPQHPDAADVREKLNELEGY